MSISKEVANVVSAEIDKAVREILANHGLLAGKTTIGCGEWFDYKIVATAIDLGPNGVNLASREANYYKKFGYTAYAGEDDFTGVELTAPLGTAFTSSSGKVMAFSGVDAKKRKTPIMAIEISTGKTFLFADAAIATINKAAQK